MNATEFYKTNTKERITEVVLLAGTNYENFKQIALYGGACSGKLALKLAIASGQEMTTEAIIMQKKESTAA